MNVSLCRFSSSFYWILDGHLNLAIQDFLCHFFVNFPRITVFFFCASCWLDTRILGLIISSGTFQLSSGHVNLRIHLKGNSGRVLLVTVGGTSKDSCHSGSTLLL
jgi:hypothetical protein